MSDCWWCCHQPHGDILQMPIAYNRQTDAFVLRGTYCSWECMKAHVSERSSEHQRGIINGNIMLLRQRMYGRGSVRCTPAPHFSRLRRFGGDMEIGEFRKHVNVNMGPLNKHVKTDAKQRDVTEVVSMQQAVAQVNTATADNKMWEINRTEVNNQPLRLKREKPLKRDQNNLALMLGLKKTFS